MALLVDEPAGVGGEGVDVDVLEAAPVRVRHLRVATSTTRRRWLRSPQAIFLPSGLKTGANFHGAPSVVRRRGSRTRPAGGSRARTRPFRRRGRRSTSRRATRPGPFPGRRASPSGSGWPRPSPGRSRGRRGRRGRRGAARREGRAGDVRRTSRKVGTVAARSEPRVIGIRAAFSVARSSAKRTPPFMKTIFPSPRLGQRTSNSVNEVSFRVSLVFRSYRQRFRVFSRSDVK